MARERKKKEALLFHFMETSRVARGKLNCFKSMFIILWFSLTGLYKMIETCFLGGKITTVAEMNPLCVIDFDIWMEYKNSSELPFWFVDFEIIHLDV